MSLPYNITDELGGEYNREDLEFVVQKLIIEVNRLRLLVEGGAEDLGGSSDEGVSISVEYPITVALGGTGAESAADARTNLGLGSLAEQSTVNNDDWSGTDLAVVNGGTGASDAATARTNLGLGSLATLSGVNNSNWSGTDLAVVNGGTGASTASDARDNLGLGPYSEGAGGHAQVQADAGKFVNLLVNNDSFFLANGTSGDLDLASHSGDVTITSDAHLGGAGDTVSLNATAGALSLDGSSIDIGAVSGLDLAGGDITLSGSTLDVELSGDCTLSADDYTLSFGGGSLSTAFGQLLCDFDDSSDGLRVEKGFLKVTSNSGSSVGFDANGTALSFFGATRQSKKTVSGARDDPEGALANLLTALENYGLITDSTTAS